MREDAFCALARRFLRNVDLRTLKWRHHGLGMLQGEIEYEWRVHIWDPVLVAIPDGVRRVHDHRFDIDSAVLVGTVTDWLYRVVESQNGTTDVWAIKHAKVQDNSPADAVFLCKSDAECSPPCTYVAGESYSIKRRQFHTTTVDRMSVTFIRRSNFDDGDARVLGEGHSAIVGIHSPLHTAVLSEDTYAALVESAQASLAVPHG